MEFETFTKSWDSSKYLDEIYKFSTNNDDSDLETLDILHNIFSKQEPKQDGRVLDFACGPVIENTFSASRVFGEIYLSDFSSIARNEIRRWRNKDRDAFDWSHAFERVAKLEGEGVSPQTVENRMREKLKAIVPCDILQDDPLVGSNIPRDYDAIISFHALSVACQDYPTYRTGVRKLASLLKPGGLLVLSEDLEQTFWISGEPKQKFPVVYLSEQNIREALVDAALTIKESHVIPLSESDLFDGSSTSVVCAIKE